MQGIIESGMSAEGGARPEEMGGNRPASGPRREQTGGQPAQQGDTPRPAENGIDMNPETAEEQRNVLVNSMLGQLYGDRLESAARILRQSEGEPARGIGRIVTGLIGAAYKGVRDQGRAIPPGVLFQAGMVAAQAVGEMAMRMGIINQENEAEVVESGFMLGLGNFGRANGQQMRPEERERYAQLIDAMEEGKRMAMGNSADMERGSGMMMQGGA